MDKRFLILLVIIAAVIGAILLAQDFSKREESAVDKLNKLNATPTIDVGQLQTSTPSSTVSPAVGKEPEVVTLESGLKYQDFASGSGKAVQKGDTIVVHYIGSLENGKVFDTSVERGQPFVTEIGVGQVIQGWDEGIIGMMVGGKRKLFIPSALGYGPQGAGDSIPPNSNLIFEVQLIAIR